MPEAVLTTDELLAKMRGSPQKRQQVEKLLQWRVRDPKGYNEWAEGLSPARLQYTTNLLSAYDKWNDERRNPTPGIIRRGAEAAARPYAAFAEKFLVGPGRRAYRGIERATGLDLPKGLPREQIPLPATPEQRGSAQALWENVLQEATLGLLPASKQREWDVRKQKGLPPGMVAREVVYPTGKAAKQAAVAGKGLGFLTWFSRYGPGGLIHAGGEMLAAVRPAARPIVQSVLRRLGQAAPLAAGHGGGRLIEGATLKESGLTAAQTAAAWMVMAPIIEAGLGLMAGKSATPIEGLRARAEGHANVFFRGLKGRAPSEAEAVSAAERIVRARAKEVGEKVSMREVRAIRPKMTGERVAQAELRQQAEAARAVGLEPEIAERAQFAEGLLPRITADEAANLGLALEQKAEAAATIARPTPRPALTRADAQAAKADARQKIMDGLKQRRPLTKAEEAKAERYLSEELSSDEALLASGEQWQVRSTMPEAPAAPAAAELAVPPNEAWAVATGEKAVMPSAPAAPRPGPPSRPPATPTEAQLEEAGGKAWSHAWGAANQNFGSVGTLVRTTGESGREYMRLVDEASYLWHSGFGTRSVEASRALTGISKPQLTRIGRYLDGRIPEKALRGPKEKAAAGQLRAILDDLGIRPMKNGTSTIKAKEDIMLSGGKVIPRTPEGPEVWTDMRLAEGYNGTPRQLLGSREVPIQLVEPQTGALLPEVYQVAREKLRLPVQQSYFARFVKPQYLERGWQLPKTFRRKQQQLHRALVKAGHAKDTGEAKRIVTALQRARVDASFKPYRLPRIDNLPENILVEHEKALPQYLWGANRNLAWTETMGAGTSLRKEGWRGADLLNEATEREGVASWMERGWANSEADAQGMLQVLRGDAVDAVRVDFERPPLDLSRLKGGWFFRPLRSATAVTSLGRVTLTNMSQPTNTIAEAGYRNMGSALAQSLSKLSREEAMMAGVTAREGLAVMMGVSGEAWHQKLASWMIRKGYFLGKMEGFLRITAGIASRRHVQQAFVRLQKDPADAWSRKALELLRINPDKALARGKLTEDELMRAAYWGAGETQFLTRNVDLPGWYNTEWGRTLAQFLGFSYQQGKLVRRLATRDFTADPKKALKLLATLGITMPLAGELVNNIKAETGLRPRTSNKFRRYWDDHFAGGGLGLAFEVLWDAMTYSGNGDMFAGPGLSQLDQAIGNTAEILGLKEPLRSVPRTEREKARAKAKAGRWFTRRAPVPYVLGAGRFATETFWPTQEDVPFWLRELDVRQSMWPPTWNSANIYEQRARWSRMDKEQKQKHWQGLSPGDRVDFYIKLTPDERYQQLRRIGPIGEKQLLENAKSLGPAAHRRLIWAVQDAQAIVFGERARESLEAAGVP